MKINIELFTPCGPGLKYYDSQPSFEEAWNNCHRGDWMLWIAKKLNVDKRILTLAKGKCALTVVHLINDDRSKKAVQAAIDYGNGLIDNNQLTAADAAAYAAAAAAAATDDADADDAADAADDAAYAADDAAYAADTDDAAAKSKNQKQTADICREILTGAVFEKVKNMKGGSK